jgi:uncharacterized membrane protein YagU involved in acid resistance
VSTTDAACFRTPFRFAPVLAGGVLVGTFDLVFACTWWAIAADVAPIRIAQSIAAGFYGDASFDGGMRTALVGLVAHYCIATCMVGAYALVATRLPTLVRHPLRWGPPYGLFLYAAMNFVVVPLSAAGPPTWRMAWGLASIVVHVAIGTMCALLSARLFSARRRPAP